MIREDVRIKTNSTVEKKLNCLNKNYVYMMEYEKKIGDLVIKSFSSPEEEKDYYKVKKNRAQALETIRDLKFVPRWTQIEEITGISERKARYAYQAVTKAIKESFKDDTYWGKTS